MSGATLFLYPEPEKGGRGKTVLKRDGFSKQRLSDARALYRYSRELALAVRDGTAKLDEAVAAAKAIYLVGPKCARQIKPPRSRNSGSASGRHRGPRNCTRSAGRSARSWKPN